MDTATDDILLALARRSAHVTQQLQTLLDAQSDGLLKGLGRDPATTNVPAGGQHRRPYSVSPEARASIYRDDPLHSPSRSTSRLGYSHAPSTRKKVVPVRQPPPPQPPSLREAREGIAEGLRGLAAIKEDEARVYGERAQKGRAGLVGLEGLVERREGLQGEIARLEDRGRIEEEEEGLRQQEDALEREIRTLEERLSELRAELRHVRREKSERDNTRAAEASSYRNALSDIQRKIQAEVLSDQSEFKRGKAKQREGVWSLPANRRTIELVKEDVQAQIQEAEGEERSAKTEGEVCNEGAEVWAGIVSHLMTLEKRLGQEIRKLDGSRPQSRTSVSTFDHEVGAEAPNTNGDTPSTQTAGDGMRGVLDLMSQTAASLTADLERAEEQGWTLLVCCVGAELEALKEAQSLLGDTLMESQILAPPAPDRTTDTPKAPEGEGSELLASMYTANESAATLTPTARQTSASNGVHEEGHDVSDPQALFGLHENDHEHS